MPDVSPPTDPHALVVLRRFGSELEATLAAMTLEANGVPARVIADTAGGAIPALAVVFPVRLFVRAGDVELATELLDTPVTDGEDSDDADV